MTRLPLLVGALAALWLAPLRAQQPADTASAPATAAPDDSVPVGYGRRPAADVTGAVTRIDAPRFDAGRIISPEQLLQGEVAGVQVLANDVPGGDMSVRIRGASSVGGGGDPLYVIDGLPIGSTTGGGLSAGRDALNFLDPDDIASITVLRDASAAAIYGINAANGVVLITTKSGWGHATRIEYSGSASSSSAARVPGVLDAAQFAAAVATYAPYRVPALGAASTNWLGEVSGAAFGQEHHLVVSGAGPDNAFRLALGFLDQNGVVSATNTRRLSVAISYDQRLLADRLDVKADIRGAQLSDRFTPDGVLANALAMSPTQPVYDPSSVNGYWNWQAVGAAPVNPLALATLARVQSRTLRSEGNVQAALRLPWLDAVTAHVNVGYDVAADTYQGFYPSTVTAGGTEAMATPSQLNAVLEAYLGYTAPLRFLPGDVAVTAGYANQRSHVEERLVNLAGLSTDLLGVNGLPPALSVADLKLVADARLTSFFGRLDYDLAGRYLATLSVRRDRSSLFAPATRSGTFPAVALAWRASEEPFLRGLTRGADLKLRASWARTGNQGFASSQLLAVAAAGLAGQVPLDPNLRWERTEAYDVGVDLTSGRQRLRGSVDWYTARTEGAIGTVPVAAGVNFQNYVITNFGNLRNQGVELSLSARILEGAGRGPSWTADFTAAHGTAEVTSLALGGTQQILVRAAGTALQVLEPGQPANAFYVCPQAYGADGRPLEGQYVSLAGVVVTGCDPRSLRASHGPAPLWILGHSSYLRFGGFDLSITLRAWIGNYVYNGVAAQGAYQALTAAGAPFNVSTSVLKTGFVAPQYQSDVYVEDASFLRMDNVTLGYSFHSRGRPMRLFVAVQNAFTITGYSGPDPAVGPTGIDTFAYPPERTVTGGLSVRL